jgi:biotin carboxyl carrier protein
MAGLSRSGDPADAAAVRVEVAAAERRPEDGAMVVACSPAGETTHHGLEMSDAGRAVLRTDAGRRRIIFGEEARPGSDGRTSIEVVVDGWRIQLELEPERRAQLRERAAKHRGSGPAGGPLEVRAIIPGRVVSVTVGSGEEVTTGQQLLVIEAMKMQNELRATRDGRVDRIAVSAGDTIEVGDLLLVLE